MLSTLYIHPLPITHYPLFRLTLYHFQIKKLHSFKKLLPLGPTLNMFRNFLKKYRSSCSYPPSLTPLECQHKITQALQKKGPYLVGRMGWLEGFAIGSLLTEGKIEEALREKLASNAGVFPSSSEEINRFSKIYLEALRSSDLLGLIRFPYEGWLIKKYAPHAVTADLGALEPFFSEEPWSFSLQGLTVLVVHPFSESIQHNYLLHRNKLFKNPNILPDFSLRVIKAPQTLEALKIQVQQESFDVALVGCGAYGLPLGAAIKAMGKMCVHLGGATQLLFGIRGGRWSHHPSYSGYRSLMTEAWTAPLDRERPVGWDKIEDGCYW